MVARAFSAGVLVAAAGYLSTRSLIEQRTADSLLRLEEMRARVNPPVRRPTAKKPLPRHAVEHEYYTNIREGWNSRVFAFRDLVVDALKEHSQFIDLLDALRAAYMRDVVVVRDRLQAHGRDEALAALPSLDLKPLLPLFSPVNCVLKVAPCSDDAIDAAWAQVQSLEEHVAALKAMTAQAAASATAAAADLARMQRLYLREQSTTQSLTGDKKRLEAAIEASAARVASAVRLQYERDQLQAKADAMGSNVALMAAKLAAAERDRDHEMQRRSTVQVALDAATDNAAQLRVREEEATAAVSRLEATIAQLRRDRDVAHFELHQMTLKARSIEEQTRLKYAVDLQVLSSKLAEAQTAPRERLNRMGLLVEDYEMRLAPLFAAYTTARRDVQRQRMELLQLDATAKAHARALEVRAVAAEAAVSALTAQLATAATEAIERHAALARAETSLRLAPLWVCLRLRLERRRDYAFRQLLRQMASARQQAADAQVAQRVVIESDHRLELDAADRRTQAVTNQLRDVTEAMRGLEGRLQEQVLAGKVARSETHLAQRRAVELDIRCKQLETTLELRELACVAEAVVVNGAALAYEDTVAQLLRRLDRQIDIAAQDRRAASHALQVTTDRLEATAAALRDANTELQALNVRYAKCYKRLKQTTDTAKTKAKAASELALDVDALVNQIAALEQKLAGETRRGAMYVEIADSMTKVIHEQTSQLQVLTQRVHLLESITVSPEIAFSAMLQEAAARCLQCAWRARKLRRVRAFKHGIYLQEHNFAVRTLDAEWHKAAQGLHWIQVTQATAASLASLGVNAHCLLGAARWADAKADAAARMLQNTWRLRMARRARGRAVGSAERLQQEQAINQRTLRRSVLRDTISVMDVAKAHMRKLAALGVTARAPDQTRK
ncbi:hypothetical protein ACHHYP_08919 [Achlya hypogyna]|uniref:Uncharacterized protein n=1 Tax=Achlya hypogyna TaxID=1202772 RepID=A0A1V9ZKC9_ACHHY|nr:hypothetical protein ACHHYP_08919 [Achlya hypogyna]